MCLARSLPDTLLGRLAGLPIESVAVRSLRKSRIYSCKAELSVCECVCVCVCVCDRQEGPEARSERRTLPKLNG